MDQISIYSSTLLDKIIEAKEISYYELKNYFKNNKLCSDNNEKGRFDLDNELDKLEELGIIEQDEGMIIFQYI